MMRLGHIIFAIAAILLSSLTASAGEGVVLLQNAQSCCDEPVEPHQTQLRSGVSTLLSTTPTSGAAQSITPVVRTLPRGVRGVDNSHSMSRAVSAIDSTTAAARYGLYNHKILFVSYARYHYLYRLVRLII